MLYQDLNDPNYSETNGGWKWVDGTTLESGYQNTQFDNNFGGTEHWGNFMDVDYYWNDFDARSIHFSMAIPINNQYNQNVTCNGGNDGQTYVTASGGTAHYTYLWDDGQITDTAYNLTAGDSVVTVTDDKGCTTSDTATIPEPAVITGTDTNTACDT